jgi:hypothetical protein
MIVALCCCIDFGTVLELRLNLQISEQLKYAAVDLTSRWIIVILGRIRV